MKHLNNYTQDISDCYYNISVQRNSDDTLVLLQLYIFYLIYNEKPEEYR